MANSNESQTTLTETIPPTESPTNQSIPSEPPTESPANQSISNEATVTTNQFYDVDVFIDNQQSHYIDMHDQISGCSNHLIV